MDPRSLTHACAVQQGSIASGCCWRNHGQCSVKSSPPNSPHVAVKMSKRCFSKKKGRMREKSHRGSWDPDSQDTTRVASQFGFVGAVAASAHCSLRLLSVLAYIYIYTCVWWAGCGYFLFNQTENWDLVSLMCGVEHLAVFIQEMQAVVFVMTVSSVLCCVLAVVPYETQTSYAPLSIARSYQS